MVLTLGMTALALVAWAISGALGAGPAPPGSAGSSLALHPAGGPPAASSTGTADRHPAAAGPGYCWRNVIVLSLSASQSGYGPGQLPQFDVDVVSTEPATCLFNVGASDMALLIYSGSRQLWSSADCVAGNGSLVTELQRGVPTVLPISWNRRTAAPGCPRSSSRTLAGSYSAVVRDGALASNSVAFRLS